MATLEERLARIREGAKARFPAPVYEMMTKATADLVASGQASRAVTVGDRMPTFTLPALSGRPVTSDGLLARGPLVVSFYRGRW